MTSVLSEYFKFYDEYYGKYGGKTAVLMQVGSFYEMYGVDNDTDKLGNAEELSKILNIVLTKRNKKIQANGINNPLMLGFPCLALNKYTPLLLAEDYTVVIVNQVKTPLSIKRSVVDVISPSINIDSVQADPTNRDCDNYLVLIYVDKHRHVGMSAISVLTGNSFVHEHYSDPGDPDRPLDEALGFLKQYRPKEAVLSGELSDGSPLTSLISYLELDDVLYHTVHNKKRLGVEYQNAVLGLAFENDGMLSNIEHLGMERMPYALLSYVLLIDFVYDHNPLLLRRMSPPDFFSLSNKLVLSTSTIEQLNIVGSVKSSPSSKGSKHTLLNVVNKCSTNAGRRLLMKRIFAPAVDASKIEKRYDQVDDFGATFSNDLQTVDKLLSRVADIERLQRRMLVGVMTPSELANLVLSYEAILDLNNLLTKKVCTSQACSLAEVAMRDNCKADLEWFIGMCRYMFNVDSMLGSDAVLNAGVSSKLDRLKESIQFEMSAISEFALDIGIDNPRIERNNSMGHCLIVTSSQAKAIKQSHCSRNKNIVVKSNASSSRVTSPKIEAASRKIESLSEAVKSCTQKLFKATIECLLHHTCMFGGVVSFVSTVDVIKSNLYVSKMYNYCRPTVVSKGTSFVDAKGLRHPVIERIDDGNEYVPNDIAIGKDYNGIILYSMNSCGKTSLLRALGLSVILAQAGCFVPASAFTFMPFRCMMTRILSRDNIMKGQSSFVAEMVELKAILKRANDPSTLVLADEITHGTEHTSGSSIFISAVETLAKRQANFLFTTHLHNVYPFVKNVPNLKVFHLSVAFENKKILFERKLKDGPGGSIYGLEVCEFIGMDTKFIARAFQVRSVIIPEKNDNTITPKPKPSKYNKQKMVQSCEECGYSPRLPTDSLLDTHHVKHQSSANENGMISGVHKDALSNLRVLCKQCHRAKHV